MAPTNGCRLPLVPGRGTGRRNTLTFSPSRSADYRTEAMKTFRQFVQEITEDQTPANNAGSGNAATSIPFVKRKLERRKKPFTVKPNPDPIIRQPKLPDR